MHARCTGVRQKICALLVSELQNLSMDFFFYFFQVVGVVWGYTRCPPDLTFRGISKSFKSTFAE